MQEINPVIEKGWKEILRAEFQSPYFSELKEFLVKEKQKFTIYPPGNLIFNAFQHTPFDRVRVVILGQDPYHGNGQAHGLCFSVPSGVRQPPSLVNIFKELHTDLDHPVPEHGNLEKWANQGVLLLNATLTVRDNQAGWGRYAQAKETLIDNRKHLILKAAHPSPLSAYNGFFGCKHFSKTNDYLEQQGNTRIDWTL